MMTTRRRRGRHTRGIVIVLLGLCVKRERETIRDSVCVSIQREREGTGLL